METPRQLTWEQRASVLCAVAHVYRLWHRQLLAVQVHDRGLRVGAKMVPHKTDAA